MLTCTLGLLIITAAVMEGRCLPCTLVMIDWSGLCETTSDLLLTVSHSNSTNSAALHAEILHILLNILAR